MTKKKLKVDKQGKHKENIAIQINYISNKKEKKKPYRVIKHLKDGSLLSTGINKRHHRYRYRVLVVKDEAKIEKIFNKAKAEVRKGERASFVFFYYQGRYIKAQNKVEGIKGSVGILDISKKPIRKAGKGRGQSNALFTHNPADIFELLNIFAQDYLIRQNKEIIKKYKLSDFSSILEESEIYTERKEESIKRIKAQKKKPLKKSSKKKPLKKPSKKKESQTEKIKRLERELRQLKKLLKNKK